jgi:phosphate transport system substrate-binding protein
MNQGLCTNLPSRCSKAASKEPIPMTTPDLTCPECGSRLQPMRGIGTAKAPARRAVVVAVVAVTALIVLVGLLATLFGHRGGNGPAIQGGSVGLTTAASPGDYLLRLSGSNTIGEQLGPELVKAWLTSKGATDLRVEQRSAGGKLIPERVISARLDGRDVKIEVRAHGSATAFTDLHAGTADVGMASRAIKPEEVLSLASFGDMRSTANEHVLGLDGVAVALPQENSIAHLSRSDLKRIFSGDAKNWSDFGGQDRPIHLYARDDNSGTYDTFKELVLKGAPLGEAKRFEDSVELEAAVAQDVDGIGFIGMPYIKTTHAVAVSDGSATALEPTYFSVKIENYPLSRRLFLYTAASPSNPAVREFVTFALSSAGQAVVKQMHFVDLDLGKGDTGEPPPPQTPCRLSARWEQDPDAYCNLRDGAEQLHTSFRFRTGSSELDTRASQDLRRVLERMEGTPDKQIILAGFADSSGGYEENCALSRARAASVAAALKTLGLSAAETLGFCQELPVGDNETADGREKNRRVEIFLR